MSTEPTGETPLTRTELAVRHRVHRSAIGRALRAAREAHERDPAMPAPPAPINPGATHELWLPSVFDPWWAERPGRGRPKETK